MVRVRLWPSSPSHPQTAYTFELLDWMEALLLECQVALKDFCSALYFKCPHIEKTKRDVYASLIDSFEEYRYMKHELRNLSFISDELDNGNICPACPKDGGQRIVSLDAIFGLPRRKKAGISIKEPLHGKLFFADQVEVDDFVAKSVGVDLNVEDCSDFKAGAALRSSSRYHALDETGIFGAGCRHEFPLFFCNLKHGERYSYAVWMIEYIINHSSSSHHFIYDIACNLTRHLQKSGRSDLLSKIMSLSVPSFHSYGHCAACQIVYSPLRTKGIGLSDGEVMERLWSFLRRFNKMTKEMRPSHRVDILTHALLYYCMKRKEKLSKLLASRWARAQSICSTAKKNFEEMTSSLNASEKDVLEWIEVEKSLVITSVKNSENNLKQSIKASFVKRKFLLELKSKYADGQKIAKKLTVQINKETDTLKRLMVNQSVTFEELSNPFSSFWEPVDQKLDVRTLQMRQSIIQNYLLLQRSHEEIKLLRKTCLILCSIMNKN